VGRGTITGRVVDARTGAPMEGVEIRFLEKRGATTTDAEGRFVLRTRNGPTALAADFLGYREATAVVTVAGDTDAGTFRLEPDPVMLESLTATVDRFESRRKAYAYSTRVLERREILASSAPDAAWLVLSRGGVSRTSCSPGILDFDTSRTCLFMRGRPGRTRIYIDEMPAIGGLDQLASYSPHDLYRVEVYGGGAMIRVYTRWYIEHAAKHGLRPMPLIVGG
jgi:hypothetical protein